MCKLSQYMGKYQYTEMRFRRKYGSLQKAVGEIGKQR